MARSRMARRKHAPGARCGVRKGCLDPGWEFAGRPFSGRGLAGARCRPTPSRVCEWGATKPRHPVSRRHLGKARNSATTFGPNRSDACDRWRFCIGRCRDDCIKAKLHERREEKGGGRALGSARRHVRSPANGFRVGPLGGGCAVPSGDGVHHSAKPGLKGQSDVPSGPDEPTRRCLGRLARCFY